MSTSVNRRRRVNQHLGDMSYRTPLYVSLRKLCDNIGCFDKVSQHIKISKCTDRINKYQANQSNIARPLQKINPQKKESSLSRLKTTPITSNYLHSLKEQNSELLKPSKNKNRSSSQVRSLTSTKAMSVFDSIQQQVLKNTKLEDLDQNDEKSPKKYLNSARKSNASPVKDTKET